MIKNTFFTKFLFSLVLISVTGGFVLPKNQADIILKRCTAITLDDYNSTASTIGIKGGKIIYVGNFKNAKDIIGENTRIYDLNFSYVYPGFTDSHCHMKFLGETLYWVNLRNSHNMKEVIGNLEKFKKTHPAAKIILAFNLMLNIENLDNHLLNLNFPDIPIVIYRADLHSALLNEKALKIAKINENTKIKGGRIVKKGGKITGVLIDKAMELINTLTPNYDEEKLARLLELAMEECTKNGITEVHDAGIDEKTLNAYLSLYKKGKLKTRIYGMALYKTSLAENLLKNGEIKTSDQMIKIKAIKYFADGSLGSKSAYISENYLNSESKGLNLIDKEALINLCETCVKKNLQICVHAIGDVANERVLDILCHIKKKYPDKEIRFRIEHAQFVNEKFLNEIKNCNVLISLQPIHYLLDIDSARKVLSERILKFSYIWNSFVKNRVKILLGTDFPVAPISPIKNYYIAITRGEKEKNMYVVNEKEKLERFDALKGLTLYPSYGAYQEKIRGKIFPGMAADLTVLDRNILFEPPERVKEAVVLMTIVNGKIVYLNKNFFEKKN